jgi:predicted acylesterase/phospholipase RssA
MNHEQLDRVQKLLEHFEQRGSLRKRMALLADLAAAVNQLDVLDDILKDDREEFAYARSALSRFAMSGGDTSKAWTSINSLRAIIQRALAQPNDKTQPPTTTQESTPLTIALALSGGGFRATFFHLGVLRYLSDVKLLGSVTDVSAVSGGSILAAHLRLQWKLAQSDFTTFASQLIRFGQIDVRNRIAFTMPFFLPFGRLPYLRWLTATWLLQRYYHRHLFEGKTLDDLQKAGGPNISLLTSNLSFPDHLCSFTEEGLLTTYPETDQATDKSKWSFHRVRTGRPSIALGVAASSCVPGIFPAIRIDASSLRVNERDMLRPQQWLVDGGVYDNLGLSSLRSKAEASGATLLIGSDAGARTDWAPRTSFRQLIRSLMRMTDLLFDRVRAAEQDLSTAAAVAGKRFCSISIHGIDRVGGDSVVPPDTQSQLPRVRTDLDRFTEAEIRALVRHGQSMARKSLQEDCGIVPPANYQPWDPFGREDVILASALDGSERRHLRIPRGSFWFGYAALGCLVGAVLIWYLWSYRSRPTVLYSTVDVPVESIDVSNAGFRVQKRSVLVDMRNETPVPREQLDLQRVSPTVQEVTLEVYKEPSAGRWLSYQVVSQRMLNEVFPLSQQPAQVTYQRVEGILELGLNNVWTIVFDTQQHLPEIRSPFQIKYRVVRYNAYQSANNNYVGTIVSGSEDLIEMRVLLPRGKTISKTPLIEYHRLYAGSWSTYLGPSKVTTDPDGSAFTWCLTRPEPGFAYRASIDWSSPATQPQTIDP